jgi:transcriptional regulator with PAS, ATPase and Fis domain
MERVGARAVRGGGGDDAVGLYAAPADPCPRPAMTHATGFPVLLGEHPVIEKVQALIAKLAATDTTVLVTGESGTGKELAARALHALSARASKPFLTINCGAIPGELLESELFGHERGAFTGATNARAGLLQLAHEGTVFLDEVAEMDAPLQVKLLRVLQDGEVRPVGADRVIRVDVRIVAATNKDLQRAVEEGLFREDLYYRLQVVPLELPALRERRSDVPVLAAHFLAQQASRRPDLQLRIAADAMATLREYDWPGNVRELENLIERLVVLADDPVIRADDLPAEMRTFISEKRIPRPHLPEGGIDLSQAVLDFQQRLIAEALRRTKGNKQAAARLLGLGRTTLVAKLRRLPACVASAAVVPGPRR